MAAHGAQQIAATPGSSSRKRDTRALTSARSTLALVCVLISAACSANPGARDTAFTNEEFWRLVTTLSEPEGSFDLSDNLVSNELLYAQIARMVQARGGVYIGVGPEQNFSYIARVRPTTAFIVDIRRDNRNLHLLYKALFELTEDRVDFVSRLFSRQPSRGIVLNSSVDALFDRLEGLAPSPALLENTKAAVRQHLTETRGLPLSPDDLRVVYEMLDAFAADGPDIRYGRRSMPPSRSRPSFEVLMTRTDLRGTPRSFLASDETFEYVKGMHQRNVIIPVIGDFAGPHTLKQIGELLRGRGEVLTAFYASNVEVYLTRSQTRAFCRSLAALPAHEDADYIGSRQRQPLEVKLSACNRIPPSLYWPPQ